MNQVFEFFQKLFEISDWPARWNCGKWSEFHGWLYIFSDITIWLAYFIIPIILIWFIQKQPKIPFSPLFFLFGAFILFCGMTHLIDALIFWWPGYRVSALIRFMTAIVSMMTVFALARELPKLLNIQLNDDDNILEEIDVKTKAEWQSQLNKRDELIKQLRKEIYSLKSNNE